MPYDLFISYARSDNNNGQVNELKVQVESDYRGHTGEDLRSFFDITEINAMDDWRNRILAGLRESSMLLLVLTPAYLKSDHCEWEIVEFLKYEHSRAVQCQGVVQVYFVEIPGLDTPGFELQSADWVKRVRKRNHIDLRPWHDEGAKALMRTDVRTRLEDLKRSLVDRLSRLRRIVNAPGNLPAHNPRFVGREVEIERLHKAAGLGQYGLLTAVQGVGGMGKTALAIQYAYAYADFYPGGRWVIGCAGKTNLASVLRSLDSDLGIQFTDDEKLDDNRAAKRVLWTLQNLAESGASARAGERNPPNPRALLIFDNMDTPELIQPPNTDLLSGRNWLHIIATTRLDPDEFGNNTKRHFHLAVDEFPEEDAVQLIERYQPQGYFPTEEERLAAHGIAQLLCGYPLAVEVVAVHLADRKGRITCAVLLQRLHKEGVDEIAKQTKGAVSHVEKLVSLTLLPTLESLAEEELQVLNLTALLPADNIALPWVRAVVAKDHPELGEDADEGYDDPWLCIINHLIGLRLLQLIDWADDRRTPRICRMHRLIQEVVNKEQDVNSLSVLESDLAKIVKVRAVFLDDRGGCRDRNNEWEIHPLSSFAWQTLKANEIYAPFFASRAASCFKSMGNYSNAQPLLEQAIELSEKIRGTEHPITLEIAYALASILDCNGDYHRAEKLYMKILETSERVFGADHPNTTACVGCLAGLLENRGDYVRAQQMYERVLAINAQFLGAENYETLRSICNLVELLSIRGDYAGIQLLLSKNGDYKSKQELFERTYDKHMQAVGPENPHTMHSLEALARLLSDEGDFEGAELLFRKVINTKECVFGLDHPSTLLSLTNLAIAYSTNGYFEESIKLYMQLLISYERTLGSEHPNTLLLQMNIARLYKNRGEYESALDLHEQVLKKFERLLGPKHAYTYRSEFEIRSVYLRMMSEHCMVGVINIMLVSFCVFILIKNTIGASMLIALIIGLFVGSSIAIYFQRYKDKRILQFPLENIAALILLCIEAILKWQPYIEPSRVLSQGIFACVSCILIVPLIRNVSLLTKLRRRII